MVTSLEFYRRWVRRFTSLLPITAGVLYAAFAIESVLDGPLDPTRAYVSELSAQGQPFAVLFRLTDALAGLVIAIWAGLALSRRPHRLALVGWLGLLVFGISTVLDATFPLSCAATHDVSCRVREAVGDLPTTHQLHVVTSTVASTSLIVAIVAMTPLRGSRRGWLRVPAVGYLVGTVWTLWEVWQITTRGHQPESLLGIAQRVQLVCAAAWLVTFGVLQWRGGRRVGVGLLTSSAARRP